MFVVVAVVITAFIGYRLSRYVSMNSLFFRIAYTLYAKTQLGYYYHLHQLEKYKSTHDQPHSIVASWSYGGVKVLPIPIASDNYSYLIIDSEENQAVVVDPSDPNAVKEIIASEQVQLKAILTTHKHWDHSGGNSVLQTDFPGIPIYGSAIDDVPCLTHPVKPNDILKFGRLSFTAVFTPGHTIGHTVYILSGEPFGAPDCLFSGDLLFLGGCGRIFEGEASEMLESLNSVAVLKDSTLLWPGHEYAAKNLLFALTIEPDNPYVRNKLDWVIDRRANKNSTCPSTIGEEKLYNPFLRTHVHDVMSAVGVDILPDEQNANLRAVAVLVALRERKDNFK
ncbi:probable hydrolase PNKD [Exaiptasia diaphana]|uniref:Metallo-beta-lactamase domain-containing protein n=1 Tax=Exaiptasia diaphana TaxID=2652724 RepID=A0A913XI74_EXADI|nr:probable hydrolase PNKD [Exaiptasia diaphana]KXJ25892.1 putative hydrolase PNKD [Exaiptasia diaphana]